MKMSYRESVEIYRQYQKDVVKVGVGLNLIQVKTLLLLESNIRDNTPKLKWYQKLIGSFKNRKS